MSVLPVYSSPLCSHMFPFVGDRRARTLPLPREFIEKRNREIAEVDWAKKEYLASSAASLLAVGKFVSHIAFGTAGAGVGAFLLVGAIALVIAAIWRRSEFFQKKEELKKEMDQYPRRFLFEDCGPTKTLCTPAETESIRPYLDSNAIFREGLDLQVRHTYEYSLDGGEETLCGWTPLSLKEQFISDQEERIRQEYRPWVDLLLFVKDAQKIPIPHRQGIGRAIGRMLYSYRWMPHHDRAMFKTIDAGVRNVDILFGNDRSRDGKMWIVVCTNQGTKSFNRAEEFRASLIQYYQLHEEAISK